MPSLREIRDMLLFAHSDNLISEEECLLLYDLNKSSNLELPYWSYDQFDLDLLSDDECKSEHNAIFVLWSMGSKLFVYFLSDLHILVDIQICCQGLQDLSFNFV